MRVLTDAGLVETHTRAPHEPNRYVMTEKGAAWFGSEGNDAHVLRTGVHPFSQSADHLVAVARVWAALAARLSQPGAPRLTRFITEGEIRRALGRNTRGALIPDGLAVVEGTVLAVEVDFAHERRGVFAAKLAKYGRHLRTGEPLYGLPLSGLVILANSVQRLAALALAAREQQLEHAVFFQSLDRLSSGTLIDGLATVGSLTRAGTTGCDPFIHTLVRGS
jgi:hypothetical protein